jgi:stage III sporulation protein SpoIIIAA
MQEDDDFLRFVNILPETIQKSVQNHPQKNNLVEIVLDLGRRPEARFYNYAEYLSPKLINSQDLEYSVKRLTKFADDNRAGIERTLHRISCMRNRDGLIIGLTCRVGRVASGTLLLIRDLLETKKSILFLGRPGIGKTTLVREVSRVMSNQMLKRIIIIDTSNEIAGDSDVPHRIIGRARRMQVQRTGRQHKVMIEAVENHMPEVIIIDEIGNNFEVLAAQTIAERGVQLIGTAHGHFLTNLIKNPILSDLIGGLNYVTLSDEESKRRGTQKTVLERKGLASFQLVIEVNERNSWTIYEDIELSVDRLLQGLETKRQIRNLRDSKNTEILLVSSYPSNVFNRLQISFQKNWLNFLYNKISLFHFKKINNIKNSSYPSESTDLIYIYYYSISPILLRKRSNQLALNVKFTQNLFEANYVVGLSSHLNTNFSFQKLCEKLNIKLFLLEKNNNREIRLFFNLLNF